MSAPILPGATLGVFGGGQLGRMFALAARALGYRVHSFSPERDTPAGQVADREIAADFNDADAVDAFARDIDVVTFEFENVPATAAEIAGRHVPVRPAGNVLHVAQNRLREKSFLARNNFPTAAFEHIIDAASLDAALLRLGRPAVLKTAGFGYDGKGQAVIGPGQDAVAAWASIGAGEAILEGFVDFEREVSVVAARGADGTFEHFGVTENRHRNHILDLSVADAELPGDCTDSAIDITRGLMDALEAVGVLCVEFFVTRDGGLLVNEMAPRPHNSGHFTIDACVTSQFEQQVRSVCGLPLGGTTRLRPSAMANLLGDLWSAGEPNWAAALGDSQAKLHLYGKSEARAGRKMGHITVLGDGRGDAINRALTARDALTNAKQ